MKRLDQALVERGLCQSREQARRAVLAGRVRFNEQRARKASDAVRDGDRLRLTRRGMLVANEVVRVFI